MYSICIKILFCLVASVISSEFYIVLSGRKTPRILLPMLIFASHLVILLPIYEKYEILFDVAQIIIEFVLIIFIIDSNVIDKLLMYVKVNVAWGIALLLSMPYKDNKEMFVLCTLALGAMVCYLIIKINKKDNGNRISINGKMISFCLCISMLCMLYTVSVIITSLDKNWGRFTYICMIIVIAMIYQLLLLNDNLKRNESRLKKYFILKRIDKKIEVMKGDIFSYLTKEFNELEKAEDNLKELYTSLYDIFSIRDKILEDKRKIADNIGCNMSVEINDSAFWGHIKPENASAIMNNLIDNALEAVSLNSVENRKIKITFINQGMIVENPYEHELNWDGDRLVTNKTEGEHGYGLQHVESLARVSRGNLKYYTDNGIFRVEVKV